MENKRLAAVDLSSVCMRVLRVFCTTKVHCLALNKHDGVAWLLFVHQLPRGVVYKQEKIAHLN